MITHFATPDGNFSRCILHGRTWKTPLTHRRTVGDTCRECEKLTQTATEIKMHTDKLSEKIDSTFMDQYVEHVYKECEVNWKGFEDGMNFDIEPDKVWGINDNKYVYNEFNFWDPSEKDKMDKNCEFLMDYWGKGEAEATAELMTNYLDLIHKKEYPPLQVRKEAMSSLRKMTPLIKELKKPLQDFVRLGWVEAYGSDWNVTRSGASAVNSALLLNNMTVAEFAASEVKRLELEENDK
jgi:hypothetical protein